MQATDRNDDRAAVIDLAVLAQAPCARQPAWSCASADLNANLIVLDGEAGIPAHVNAELDVLIVGIAGEGTVEVDGAAHRLAASTAILIPKGTNRAIRCGGRRLAYLTCHQRRAGLWPQGLARPGASTPRTS